MTLTPTVATAADTKNKGLYISPLRDQVTVEAGSQQTYALTVANLTDNSMTVDLKVQQFSVSDYAYDYIFRQPDNDWIKLTSPQVVLRPNESRKVTYQLNIPPASSPGGYYFTLFASTTTSTGMPGTVRAGSLLYVTVNGKLTRTGVLEKDSLPWFVTGSTIPYRFDVRDTGNIHYTAYFYGKIEGLFGQPSEVGTSHLLMPGTVRTVSESIPSPLLPGIYKVTYGYRADGNTGELAKTAFVVFAPPWAFVIIVLVGLIGRWWWQQRRGSLAQ